MGPPPPARRDPGQERGGDTLGNEAIIWYFLPEQLQIGGNYIPEGGGQGREPGDTKNLPHQSPTEAERPVFALASGEPWIDS